MHPAISDSLLALPNGTESPRTTSYAIPGEFNVDPKGLLFKAHIRTNTPGYGPQPGGGAVMFSDDDSRLAFEKNSAGMMASLGMQKDGPWFYPADGSRSTYVHAHPDHVSGVMTVAQINSITDAVASGRYGFSLRWVDVYDVYEHVSDEEALRRIHFYERKIREDIVAHHVTTRKTKFKTMDLLAFATRLPGMSFAGEKGFGGYQPSVPDVIMSKLLQIRDDLLREGWLVAAEIKGHTYYRTANKTEQRARGLLSKAEA